MLALTVIIFIEVNTEDIEKCVGVLGLDCNKLAID